LLDAGDHLRGVEAGLSALEQLRAVLRAEHEREVRTLGVTRPEHADAVGGHSVGMRVRCVGAIVHDADGRLLVIRRGHPPGEGLWSLPGGRVEPGESDAEAVVRELSEETGLRGEPGRLIGSVERPGSDGMTYDIHDYAAAVIGGTLHPGDDASEARWVSPAQLRRLPTTDGLIEALTGWHVLPRNV
jgi:ADP-ribose pyrophosphatase YjhB (NUDIX family)